MVHVRPSLLKPFKLSWVLTGALTTQSKIVKFRLSGHTEEFGCCRNSWEKGALIFLVAVGCIKTCSVRFYTVYFFFMAKGQRKEMLSWCSAVGHIQRIFTSTLLHYNFSCSSVFASSARKGSESPFQTGLTHYVPGKHFCLLFPVCSHMVPNIFSVEGFHSHTVTHWYESTVSFFLYPLLMWCFL